MFPMAKEQREISVNTSTIHHFEIIFDNPDFSRLFVPFSMTRSTSERKSRFFTPTFIFSMCFTLTIWQMLADERP